MPIADLRLTALGAGLAIAGGLSAWALVRAGRPLKVAPWPGLTWIGACTLLALAVLWGGLALLLGPADMDAAARAALPYLPLAALGGAVALALAVRLFAMPGAAAAVCGTYLLARSVVSLRFPGVALPPLFLVGTVALELVLWLRPSDLTVVLSAWPRPGRPAPPPDAPPAPPRQVTDARALLGGVLFGVGLALEEPPFELLLGADPARWDTPDVILAGLLAAAASAAAVWTLGRSVQDRA